MHSALIAIAKLTNVNLQQASKKVRRHPLFDEEIHIYEELINLEEAIKSYHMASGTLKQYPSVHKHILRERRDILQHCIGLISRMLEGKSLPRQYGERDIRVAMHKLIALIITDAQRVGYAIDQKLIEAMKPYMNGRQRRLYARSFDVNILSKFVKRRSIPVRG